MIPTETHVADYNRGLLSFSAFIADSSDVAAYGLSQYY
jgi:hypothetical protein